MENDNFLTWTVSLEVKVKWAVSLVHLYRKSHQPTSYGVPTNSLSLSWNKEHRLPYSLMALAFWNLKIHGPGNRRGFGN